MILIPYQSAVSQRTKDLIGWKRVIPDRKVNDEKRMPCVLTETSQKMFLTALDIPTEGVRHVQDETTAFVENASLGNGSLYVTEK